MLIRVGVLAVMLLVIVAVWRSIGDVVRAQTRRAARAAKRPRTVPKPSTYDWDRRTDQVKRQLKKVDGPQEQRAAILAFIEGHRGVEAYVEPRTAISPLSVVLVDDEGEWRRFELKEDAFIRELAASRRLRVYDAAKTGYPARMRRRRRREV